MESHYDIIVIGKGLAGAAAAKYLCASPLKVAVIGADEPRDNHAAQVYASHYDQARVQRMIGKDAVWTRLNHDSASQYEAIQQESGLQFHAGVGCLYVNPYGQDDYLKHAPALAEEFGISCRLLATEKACDGYGLTFPAKSVGLLEAAPAGYLNPRLLIQAQLEIFKNRGGTIFSDTVMDLYKTPDGRFALKTHSGSTFFAANVLVATGSFMNHLNILPQKVHLTSKSEVVLLVKVDQQKVEEYASLPSLLYEIDEADAEGVYMIPPVKYPDGNYYLKIGCNSPYDLYFDSLEQIQDWFRHGKTEKYAAALLHVVHDIFPGLNLDCTLTKKCIISRTPTGRPYIGETPLKGLYLAGGCNGYSAMCSDAIGRVAAHFVLHGAAPSPYPADGFRIVYAA
jgi:sarcosine oxidase